MLESYNNVKTNKHVKFDLSQNKTFIIDNEFSSIYLYETIPFITILSSLLFLTNSSFAFFKKNYLYATGFLFLTITSLLFRLYANEYTLLIDKTAILAVVLYGAYIFLKNLGNVSKLLLTAIASTFIATIILYYYGYTANRFCFDQDIYIAENYTALLYILSSIGHNMLIMLL